MSKFAVYGLGNALVDIVYDVEDSLLKKLNIDKSVMTLVEEEHQKKTLDQLCDIPLVMKSCGGSAANTLIAVTQLGGKAFYSCKVANDGMGDFFHEDLLKNHVSTNLQLQVRESGTTGSCVVLITPDAQRSMNTYLGISNSLSEKELILDYIKESQYLYIEGYLVSSPTGRAASITARKEAEKHNVKTALSLSDINMVKFFYDGLFEIIGKKVDLIFCNEQEALKFAQVDDLSEAKSFIKKFAHNFAITLGAEGAIVFDGQEEMKIDCPPHVIPKDSNGAGDMFAGAFLYAITHGHDFKEAGELACRCASKLVTIDGPRMGQDQTLHVYNDFFRGQQS